MTSHRSTLYRAVLVLGLALAALPGLLSAQEGAGVITGKVFSPTGEVLDKAEITIADLNLKAISNREGGFILRGVPAGTHTLNCAYIGLPSATAEVEMAAGASVTQNFNLAYGDVIEVRGSPLLVGQAKALNKQKNAVNISNIVASDQIGRFPDSNAAEATQRIPGISLLRDQGEGRYVLVRGTEARLNSTTVNGERIPSPEAGTRDIALDTIPSDLLESIEVAKALTPDMDGDAIGGSVDLITARAPEQLRVSAALGVGYRELVEDEGANGSFTYGQRYADGKTGLLLSLSGQDNSQGSDNFEPEYDDGELEENQLRDYTFTRERYGLTADLDIRGSDRSSYYLRGLATNYQDDERRRARVDKVGDGEIERAVRDRLQESDIYSLSFGGENIVGSSLVVDYRLTWNSSSEETIDQLTSVFIQEDVIFDPNVSPDFIDPDNIQTNPQNEDLNAFEFDELEQESKWAEEEDLIAAINFTQGWYRDADFSGLWKAGAKYRDKTKEQWYEVFIWTIDDLLITDVLDDWQSETPFVNGRYDIGRFQSPGTIRSMWDRGEFELDEKDLEEDLNDFDASEDTLAAYGMVELLFGGRTTFLGGVRVEDTTTDYTAYELVVDEEGDPIGVSPVTGEKSYTEWLPQFHFIYRLDDRSNLRAALTRTLARPNFEDIAPWRFINREDEEIELGNPDLDVTTAINLDLMYERYLEPIGIISLGAFYKELTDSIFTFNFDQEIDGTEFEVTQPRNGEDADLWGLEMAYQNNFTDAPGFWGGFGLYLNYTYVDSDANYPDRETTRLQGQSEHTGNVALVYEKYGFSGRLSYNYNGKNILEIGGEAAEDLWVDDHEQLDFLGRVQVSDKLSLVLELINLTDEPYRVYEGSSDRPRQEEYYSWWGILGLRFDL
jgi:TonB-dependent receptor